MSTTTDIQLASYALKQLRWDWNEEPRVLSCSNNRVEETRRRESFVDFPGVSDWPRHWAYNFVPRLHDFVLYHNDACRLYRPVRPVFIQVADASTPAPFACIHDAYLLLSIGEILNVLDLIAQHVPRPRLSYCEVFSPYRPVITTEFKRLARFMAFIGPVGPRSRKLGDWLVGVGAHKFIGETPANESLARLRSVVANLTGALERERLRAIAAANGAEIGGGENERRADGGGGRVGDDGDVVDRTPETDADKECWDGLSQTQRDILEAMYKLRADSPSRARSLSEIVRQVTGPTEPSTDSFEHPAAELVKKEKLADSKRGPDGGRWLTPRGANLVKRFTQNSRAISNSA